MSSPKLTLSEMPDAVVERILARTAGTIYVIINKAGTNLVKSPVGNEPFHTSNKKYAEQIAREIGGGSSAITMPEALKVLTRSIKN